MGYRTVHGGPGERLPLGKVEVDAAGPMRVAGKAIDLGPYARWDNSYAHPEFGTYVMEISHAGHRLILDFGAGTRRLD